MRHKKLAIGLGTKQESAPATSGDGDGRGRGYHGRTAARDWQHAPAIRNESGVPCEIAVDRRLA
jgi:hypothetical protein